MSLGVVPGYAQDQALDLAQQLVQGVDRRFGLAEATTDTAVGPGNWWRYKGLSDGPYTFASTLIADDQSGMLAGQMLTAISILAKFGKATGTQKAHAKLAVAAIYGSGCYGSRNFYTGMTGGAGQSPHQFAWHWITQGLIYYRKYLATDDAATVDTMLLNLEPWYWVGTFWVDNGVTENISQSLGTYTPTAWQAISEGIEVAAPLRTYLATQLDTYVNTYMATTKTVHGDWTYRYDYSNAGGVAVDTSYKVYYHGLMLRGLQYYDEILASGVWSPSATQKAKLKNFAHVFLGAFGYFGSQIEYTIAGAAYRHGVFMRQCIPALAAIACNTDLQFDSDSANLARFYIDRCFEHVLATDGLCLCPRSGSADYTEGLPAPVEVGGINWSSDAVGTIPTPSSYTMAWAETAMNIALSCEQSELWSVQPMQPHVKLALNSALVGARASGARYSASFCFGIQSSEGNWPTSQGPEAIHLLDVEGETFGGYNQRITPDVAKEMVLLAGVRTGGTFYTNAYDGTTSIPISAQITDGQGNLSDMLTALTAYSTSLHLRNLKPGHLPFIESTNHLKDQSGNTIPTNKYDCTARYTFYKDFFIRRYTLALVAGTVQSFDFIIHFPAMDPSTIDVYGSSDGGSNYTWTQIYDGTTNASMNQSADTIQCILFRRDHRGGTAYGRAAVWCPVQHSAALYTGNNTNSGGVNVAAAPNNGIFRFQTAGLRLFVWKSQAALPDGFQTEWAYLPLTAMVDGESLTNTKLRANNAYTYIQAFASARVAARGALAPNGFQMWFAAVNGTYDNFCGYERKFNAPWLKFAPSTGNVKVFYGGMKDANVLPSATMTATITVTGLNGSQAVVSFGGTDYTINLINGEGTLATGLSLTNTGYAVRLKSLTGSVVRRAPIAIQSGCRWLANGEAVTLRTS